MSRIARVVPLLAALCATPAHAVFHISVIDEVMSGAGGDPTVQYVEIRMLAGLQNQVCHSRLTVFRCQADGGGSQVLIDNLGGASAVNPCIPNQGADVRWIMASPSATTFLTKSGVTPDFTWDSSVTGGIPTSCGMVCWGAPGTLSPPPNPPTWDATDPFQYVDCVAYGNYDGTGEPAGNAPATATPGSGTFSLTRTDSAMFSNAFDLACPTPTNNAGVMGSFGACSPPTSTTTTTATTSTTTTTAAPGKSKCTSKELSAAGTKAFAKAKCHAKAVGKGQMTDPTCLMMAETKFSTAYGKAVTAGDCRTTTDAGTIEGKVEGVITGLDTTLDNGMTTASKCTSKEWTAAGKKAFAKLKCHAKAVGKGQPTDSTCLMTAGTKFSAAYAKAIDAGSCLTSADAGTVEGQVDGFVDDVKATLAP
ncbi:MAG TPA: hypothetical protein VKU61_09705 [Candidatus Binatia bacterium]|nr:hypothetical protein [Candidatus Binatia bacterium]